MTQCRLKTTCSLCTYMLMVPCRYNAFMHLFQILNSDETLISNCDYVPHIHFMHAMISSIFPFSKEMSLPCTLLLNPRAFFASSIASGQPGSFCGGPWPNGHALEICIDLEHYSQEVSRLYHTPPLRLAPLLRVDRERKGRTNGS